MERIKQLRLARNLGAKGIQNELRCLHQIHLSSSTIHHALQQLQLKPLRRAKRPRSPNATLDL
ncbi:MAG: hypothetical protein RhofKO_34910 [Rhodothermales bacterium]